MWSILHSIVCILGCGVLCGLCYYSVRVHKQEKDSTRHRTRDCIHRFALHDTKNIFHILSILLEPPCSVRDIGLLSVHIRQIFFAYLDDTQEVHRTDLCCISCMITTIVCIMRVLFRRSVCIMMTPVHTHTRAYTLPLVLYRILWNVIKNACETYKRVPYPVFVRISLLHQQNELVIIIDDSGPGFFEEGLDGTGIRQVEHYLKILGGRLIYTPRKHEAGMRTCIILPCEPVSDNRCQGCWHHLK
jgi:hypothetical protein